MTDETPAFPVVIPKPTKRPEISREDFIELLGEGFHTAFRKATDCQQANTIWHQIQKMAPHDWSAVLEFVADGFDGRLLTFGKETK